MKTASEDLFQLIHSLRKSEKRSFKLSAATDKKEKLYVTLFDLIEAQKKYNEEEIVKKLGLKKSVYAVYKNHLYHLLLERLSVLFTSKEAELRSLLTQADLLFSKGLYHLYEKMLHRAKKFAMDRDMDNQLLEILNMEHRNAWRKRDLQSAANVMEEDKQALLRFNNQRDYTHLSNEIIIGLSKLDNRNAPEVKKLSALMKSPLIKNDKNALTFRSKYSLYHTLSLYYSVHDEPEKQYQFAKKATELYESRPEKIKYDAFTYLLSVHLMLVGCHSLKRYEEAKKYTDKLRIDPSLLANEQERRWAFFTFHDTNMNYYIHTGRFREGVPWAEELARELEHYAHKLEDSQNTGLAFHMARIYFGAKNFGKCIQWLNRILNENYPLHIRPRFESNVKLLYLIVHFEKGNFKLLQQRAKSTFNELRAQGKLFKFETVLLAFFGKKLRTEEGLTEDLLKLKMEIESIDKAEKMPFMEFDYLSWIESKIEDRSFEEIVKEKLRQ